MSALGRMSVLMGLDASEFTSGLSNAERDAGRAMRNIENAISVARVGFLALGAAAVGAATMIANLASQTSVYQDVAEKIGDTATNVASLQTASDVAGFSLDSMASLVNKLSASLAKSDDESKGAREAIALLGVDLKQFEGLKAVDRVEALAKAFAGLEDGPKKSALAIAALGKSGAEALPFFNDLVEYGRSQTQVTAEQIAASNTFTEQLAKLKSETNQLAQSMAGNLAPSMMGVLDLLGTSVKYFGDSQAAVTSLDFAVGFLKKTLEVLVVIGSDVAFVFKVIGRELVGVQERIAVIADGKFGFNGFRGISEAVKSDTDKARADLDKFQASILNADLYKKINKRDRPADFVAKKEAPDLPSAIKTTGGGATKEKESSYAALNKRISETLALFGKELELGRQLTEAEKFTAKIREDIALSKVKLSAKELADLDVKIAKYNEQSLAIKVQNSLIEQASDRAKERQSLRNKEYEQVQKFFDDERIARTESLNAANEDIRNKEFALTLIGKTNQETEVANGLRELELKGIRAGTEEYDKLAGSIRRIAAQREELEKVNTFWKDFESASRTAFGNVLDGAKDPLKSIGDLLKRQVYDLLYDLTIKEWIIKIKTQSSSDGGGFDWLKFGASILGSLGGGGTGTGGSPGGLSFGSIDGKRAAGGPVKAGGRYLVGEKGPEIVEMGAAGNVIPSYRAMGMLSSGGGMVTNNYNFSGGVSRNEVVAGMSLARQAAVGDMQDGRARGKAGF